MQGTVVNFRLVGEPVIERKHHIRLEGQKNLLTHRGELFGRSAQLHVLQPGVRKTQCQYCIEVSP